MNIFLVSKTLIAILLETGKSYTKKQASSKPCILSSLIKISIYLNSFSMLLLTAIIMSLFVSN
ncbi:hypothetical protein PSM10_18515 [Clostridioides difficile]|nr:hypothetical protein [Clostridioides difficile]